MAKRRRRRREEEEPSYWLSYSDMMAGLLLMFVIIISFTMLQSRIQFEADEKALQEKQMILEEQRETMDIQSQELLAQAQEIETTQKTLAEKEATVVEQQTKITEAENTLNSQQQELDKARQTLENQQKKLAAAKKTLASQQQELEKAEQTLAAQQQTLTAQQQTLADRENELKDAQTQLASQQKTLEEQRGQIASQQQQMEEIIGVKTELIQALRDAFAGTATVAVDSKTGSIMFESSILFDFNDAVLSEEGEDFLREFLPQYFGVLLSDEFRDYVSEIIIEGHTDTEGSYIVNLELSQQRALAVASVCLEEDGSVLDPDTVEFLRGVVTANGRSYSNPIYKENGEIDMDASRRVEFKFRLKDEEMVEQMMEILNQ